MNAPALTFTRSFAPPDADTPGMARASLLGTLEGVLDGIRIACKVYREFGRGDDTVRQIEKLLKRAAEAQARCPM